MNRHFRKNVFAASGYFIVFVFIILFISCMTIVEYTIYSTGLENVGGADPLIFDRTTYENMTIEGRKEYLANKYGGSPHQETRVELNWVFIIPTFFQSYMVFPDGTEMLEKNYNSFINGQVDPGDVSVLEVIGNALTLNFHVFEMLGILGTVIRIFLISTFIVIIYLMLPFTG